MSAPLPDLADLRRSYRAGGLSEADLGPDPHAQFDAWFTQAVASGVTEPNAMVLSTVSADLVPDAAATTPDRTPRSRTVLLKGHDHGFVFFTNLTSRKGRDLSAQPHASLLFPWYLLERQVLVTGVVSPVTPEETGAYFASRPRGSQLGAWASHQSAVVGSRADLEQALAAVQERFGDGPVPVPPFWGGLRLVPDSVEFWQGRPNRLHDRLRYVAVDGGWRVERLSP